jgi:hypothetical protein
VPIELLIDAGSEGVLATFAARGYRVLGPDEIDKAHMELVEDNHVGDAADPSMNAARLDLGR